MVIGMGFKQFVVGNQAVQQQRERAQGSVEPGVLWGNALVHRIMARDKEPSIQKGKPRNQEHAAHGANGLSTCHKGSQKADRPNGQN